MPNLFADPRIITSARSLDYVELTEQEAREGIMQDPSGELPAPDGVIYEYKYWDNHFGAFYQRPDGSFFYN